MSTVTPANVPPPRPPSAAKPTIPHLSPPFKYNHGRIALPSAEEDTLAVDVSEQLQYEKDRFVAGKGMGYVPGMSEDSPPRRSTLVKGYDINEMMSAADGSNGGTLTYREEQKLIKNAKITVESTILSHALTTAVTENAESPARNRTLLPGGAAATNNSPSRLPLAIPAPPSPQQPNSALAVMPPLVSALAINKADGGVSSLSAASHLNNVVLTGSPEAPQPVAISPRRSPRWHMGTDTTTYVATHLRTDANTVKAANANSVNSNNAEKTLPLIGNSNALSPNRNVSDGVFSSASTSRQLAAAASASSSSSPRSPGAAASLPSLRDLIAQQQVDEDPFSIRKQLKAIKPTRALAMFYHNLPLIDEERYNKRGELLGLRLLQRVAEERDPAVVWRKVTAIELAALKRKEILQEEEREKRKRMNALREEQRPKLTPREAFLLSHEQSQREARFAAFAEEERIKALDRKIKASEDAVAKEKMLREREPTAPVVHKIFDEGRQIKAFAEQKLNPPAQPAAGRAAAPPPSAPPALTRLAPLDDSEVQAKKAKHQVEMQERLKKIREASAALAKDDEAAFKRMEEAEKTRKEWEIEKRKLVGLDPANSTAQKHK